MRSADVETEEVVGAPLTVSGGCFDHRNPLAGVEHLTTAELKCQGIQPAEGGTAEPAIVRSRMNLERLVKAVEGGDVIAMEVDTCIRTIDPDGGVVFGPILVVPDGSVHLGFDKSHGGERRVI